MFEYTFKSGDKKQILTPFCTDLKQVKKEITQAPDCVHNKSTYPNGFIIDMYQYADKIIVKSNKELVDNGDGTISVRL